VGKELFEHDANLESGQRCPQTDVRSAAEGQVRVLRAADIEPTGSTPASSVSVVAMRVNCIRAELCRKISSVAV
jgi:hypothetical protein